MIHHVVMFRWKPETPDGQTELVHDALPDCPGSCRRSAATRMAPTSA